MVVFDALRNSMHALFEATIVMDSSQACMHVCRPDWNQEIQFPQMHMVCLYGATQN